MQAIATGLQIHIVEQDSTVFHVLILHASGSKNMSFLDSSWIEDEEIKLIPNGYKDKMIADLQSKLWNTEIWQHAEKWMVHGLFITLPFDLPSSTMTVNYYGFKNQYDEHWFILLFLLSLHLRLSDTVGSALKKLERYRLPWEILHLFSLQMSFPPDTVSTFLSSLVLPSYGVVSCYLTTWPLST